MLTKVRLKNFGPLENMDFNGLGGMKLIIGPNGSGKTFLLKALYCVIKTLEGYKRGREQRSDSDILVDKLYWTFQPETIGDIVTKGSRYPLSCSVTINDNDFCFSFGKDTTKKIFDIQNDVTSLSSNSIFLPAKEVLSLHRLILKNREEDKLFGFDDTYYDLAKALRQPPQRGKNYRSFSEARKKLESMLGGKVELDEPTGVWQFKKGNQKVPIGVTAEGVKKIAILDTLLGNRYLNLESTIFSDEPESALHPTAISRLLDIITLLAESGNQFFLATHSYFVIKRLYIIAVKKNLSIPIFSKDDNGWHRTDLKDGMPDNPIIDESIRIYEEEIDLVL